MSTYNDISSAVFDFLLAPFGHELPLFDLVLWPVIIGVVALVVWKYTSNQKAITKIKKQIGMHLLEIRLFRDDIAQVLKSTVTIVLKNFVYIGLNLVPMMVLLAPMGDCATVTDLPTMPFNIAACRPFSSLMATIPPFVAPAPFGDRNTILPTPLPVVTLATPNDFPARRGN